MNLTQVTDETLRTNIKSHVAEERRSTTAILYHLREIDRRDLS